MKSWTAEQSAVIELPADARVLVEAGPGTGKTAVACQRVAYLIDEKNVIPTSIVLISFTRAAVYELRQRIGSYLQDESQAAFIRITTLDSFAGLVKIGFGDESTTFRSFEEGIRELSKSLLGDSDVRAYVQTWQHLIIDEAQDIVSPRAEAMLDILDFISPECGVTVLYDDAQSIYGFAEDGESQLTEGNTLADCIKDFHGDKYFSHTLTTIHRTRIAELAEFLHESRALLKSADESESSISTEIAKRINTVASKTILPVREFSVDAQDIQSDSLILFRRRAEVLSASSWLKDVPHQIRLSQRPQAIHPWVGIMFGDLGVPKISHDEFQLLWARRMSKHEIGITVESAWSNLVRFAGLTENVVSLVKLAKVLSRQRPPQEFCLKDFGHSGPILGTIHASKGREADDVYLYLASTQNRDEDDDLAEARVLFVGASRARNRLLVGPSSFIRSNRTETGRVFSPLFSQNGIRAQVEFGRAGDIDEMGLAGQDFFLASNPVHVAQDFFATNAFRNYSLIAKRGGQDVGFSYFVSTDVNPDRPLFYLTQSVNKDLFKIKDSLYSSRRGTPQKIPHLYSLGSYTIAVDPDSPNRQHLLKPWEESGFMLAPLLCGYPTLRF